MHESQSGTTWWGHGRLADLAETYGTPLYVYSRQRLEVNYRQVADAFAPLHARIRYSVKANSNGAILRLLRSWDSGFDVVSGGELYRSLRAGAEPQSIVFAGVGKTDAELKLAVEAGIGWINAESREELEALDAVAGTLRARPRTAIRLNPAVEADTHKHIATGGKRSKFGIDAPEAESILARADRLPNMELAGLHVHIGSQLSSPHATVNAAGKALALVDRYRLRMLDIGGGFPVSYHTDGEPGQDLAGPSAFAQALAPILRDRDLEILIEPGRSIIADAGVLLTRVLSVKQRDGRQMAVVDAGMNDLVRPALYEAYHPIVPLEVEDSGRVMTDVVGPVCESADAFAHDRLLPRLRRGDLLVVTHACAYGMTMASNYNSRPRPAEVMIDGDLYSLIRERETVEDLVAREVNRVM